MAFFNGVEFQDKIFMTGTICSGKTTLGKDIAKANQLKYFDLDLFFDYESTHNQSKKILERLPERFLIDGVPPNEKKDGKRTWDDFSEFERKNNVSVICVYCSDKSDWINRLKSRIIRRSTGENGSLEEYLGKLKRKIIRFYVCCSSIQNISDLKTEIRKLFRTNSDIDTDLQSLYNELHYEFLYCFIPLIANYRGAKYYDSSTNKFTTAEELVKSLKRSMKE